MTRALHCLVAVLSVGICAAGCGSPSKPVPVVVDDIQVPEPPKLPELVRLDLLSDVSNVAPGQVLTLAARFDIEPEWHIYWTNPGDAGLATQATFIVPDGFSAGATQFPGPMSFEGAGGSVMFGYAREVLISADVTAPDSLTGSDMLTFRVEANWLACLDECVRGRGSAELSLRVASAEHPSTLVSKTLFDRHRARLPVAWSELERVAPAWLTTGDQMELSLDIEAAMAVEYFPAADNQLAFKGQMAVPREGGMMLRLRYRTEPHPSGARGVLRVTTKEGSTFYKMELAWPEQGES